ncbi:hypothetical protein HG531_000815 [Fusarium graminearum]|nr:hypothetical protein HG531_000815 [Fusarium graminearum]
MNGKQAQTRPMPHSAILVLVSCEQTWRSTSDSPSQIDLEKNVGLILTFPLLDDKHKPNETKDAGNTTNSEDSDDLEFRHQPYLELLGKRAGQKKHHDVAEKTDDVVHQDEDTLIEALAIGCGPPEHGYGTTDEHFEK